MCSLNNIAHQSQGLRWLGKIFSQIVLKRYSTFPFKYRNERGQNVSRVIWVGSFLQMKFKILRRYNKLAQLNFNCDYQLLFHFKCKLSEAAEKQVKSVHEMTRYPGSSSSSSFDVLSPAEIKSTSDSVSSANVKDEEPQIRFTSSKIVNVRISRVFFPLKDCHLIDCHLRVI